MMTRAAALRLFACLLLVPGGCSALAQPVPADTVHLGLAEAIGRALAVSPEVGAVAAERDFAEARAGLARASRFLTEFNFTSAHAPGPGLKNVGDTPVDALYLNPDVRNDWDDLRPFTRVEVEMLQPLYTWGELGGNIRAAQHGVAVESAAVQAKEAEVALRTGELYYNLLLAGALRRVAGEAGDAVARAKAEIEKLLDEGAEDVDEADRFQVLITEQELRRRTAEVEQKYLTAQAALARQLFLPEGTVVVPVDATLEPVAFTLEPLEAYTARALARRPELAQAEAGLAAREALIDVARSDYYPKLFLGASATFSAIAGRHRQRNPYVGDPFLSRGVQVGLGLRQKLNFAQTRARVEQARAAYEEVRFQAEAARQLILFEVEEAYRNVSIAREALAAREEALRLSKEWLRTEQINFDLDIGDTDNLIKAVQANLELQAAVYEAIRAYNVAVLRLQRAAGLLPGDAGNGTLVD
ncbi:MAG: transporter [Rhodothermaceae bacterium]|nr:MAG: transporter [Rhodothermaceae bacterium]